MNRIEEKLKNCKDRQEKAFITYITAGLPDFDGCKEIIKAQEEAGTDILELGIPFSDPVADGPIIQDASYKAICQGVTINTVFELMKDIREEGVELPIVFMLYYNTILHYGVREFAKMCRKAGVDGLIVPDLPYEEQGELKEALSGYDATLLIPLVSPVSKNRIPMLLEGARGFVYCVSSMGVTGQKASFHKEVNQYLQEVKKISKIPVMMGFGITKASDVKPMKEVIDGAIVGSHLIRLMEENEYDLEVVKDYCAAFKKELNQKDEKEGEDIDMKEYIAALAEGKDLTEKEAKEAMEIMLSGEASQAQIGAFLATLRMKGETLDELVGLASVLRDKAETISPQISRYVDLVGTGGDCTYTFNISTTSAFVVAAAGLPVAKHGNRSISSKSGAGDVLEALGVNIMAEPVLVERCVEETGIGFMFAQLFNKSMKYVGQARKEMGIRTVFNILGPLANPSRAKYMVVGVYDARLTEQIAQVMSRLGVERAFVVGGCDNMDEITLTGKTIISEIKDGIVTTFEITPEQFGFHSCQLADLRGGDAVENAKITRDILSGRRKGAKRDIVLLNAGATLYVGGVAESIEAGVKLAAETLDSGKALEVLEHLVQVSNEEKRVSA